MRKEREERGGEEEERGEGRTEICENNFRFSFGQYFLGQFTSDQLHLSVIDLSESLIPP